MAYVPPNPVPLWPAFFPSAPVVPKLYYDALSPEQRIKKLCEELHRLCEYANLLGENINLDHAAIEQLQSDFQRFIDGEYDQYYKDLIYKWIQDNFADLISAGVRQVYFGLTSDGYFCAYIPDSWDEITFDTGAVYGRSDYGRLILRFEADPAARNVIDNTYNVGSYSLNSVARSLRDEITQLITDLEVNANRTDYAYNTLFTNLDEVVSDGNF
jgi:hypothetical protein